MAKRDKAKLERFKESLEWTLHRLQRNAVRKMATLAEEGRPWNERTVGDVATMKLAESFAAEVKAKKAAQAAPTQLGVVVIANRVESLDEWERQYQAMESDLRERRSIPAIATVIEEKKKDDGSA